MGSTITSWLYKVPAHCFAAIKYIYCNYWQGTNDRFWHKFYIDGVEMWGGKIERQIGSPDNLHKVDPPYIARKEIRWTVYNGYTSTLNSDVICIGTCYEE